MSKKKRILRVGGLLISPSPLPFQEYRKKTIVIKAVRLFEPFEVETPEGVMKGELGDWLIIGVKGEAYPCKPGVFEATYEAVVKMSLMDFAEDTDHADDQN